MSLGKSVILAAFILALCSVSFKLAASEGSLAQSWKCKLDMEGFDIGYSIQLNSDDTYFSEMIVMTSSTKEEGSWRSQASTLFLKPNKTIQSGKEIESRAEYERKIVDVSETKLTLNHEDGFGDPVNTICVAE